MVYAVRRSINERGYYMRYAVLVITVAALLGLRCSSDPVSSGGGSSDTWCLWIAADMDATVDSSMPDVNWGQDGYNRVALGGATKRSYIHFLIPNFPEGTDVTEAYVELYHGSKNEDGKTDDIEIPFQEASDTWSAPYIIWNNQPPFSPGGTHTIDLRSQSWSASDDIEGVVQAYIDDPASHRGIVVYWSDVGFTMEKGFASNNDYRRTATEMGVSPRLLVKVKLPQGKTMADDVTLPPFPAGNDLDFPGQQVVMLRYSAGSTWPESWEAVAGT
jgi:hypothetical protein